MTEQEQLERMENLSSLFRSPGFRVLLESVQQRAESLAKTSLLGPDPLTREESRQRFLEVRYFLDEIESLREEIAKPRQAGGPGGQGGADGQPPAPGGPQGITDLFE